MKPEPITLTMRLDTMDLIFAAYVLDRAYQYDQSSASFCALEQLSVQIRKGEARAAYVAGELDDILERWSKR